MSVICKGRNGFDNLGWSRYFMELRKVLLEMKNSSQTKW